MFNVHAAYEALQHVDSGLNPMHGNDPSVKVCKERLASLQTDDTFASCVQLNMQIMASPLPR